MSEKIDKINSVKEWLKDFDKNEVAIYINYLRKLETEKKKDKETWKEWLANPWFYYKEENELIELFKKVNKQWLTFDWKHITLQSTGISFDYIALKNLMLIIYPETILDLQIVYKWDEFKFWKKDWKIFYEHKIWNPFSKPEEDIIWAYCIIKNKRWEFLTTLDLTEINKRRKKARTDSIWKEWFVEMILKTVIKSAVKIHYDDIFWEIIEVDNETNNDLEIPMDLELSWKSEIDNITDIEELRKYYTNNKWKWKTFDAYIITRSNQLKTN